MSEGTKWHFFETKDIQQIFDLFEIVHPDAQETGKRIDPESNEYIYIIDWKIADPDREKEAINKWNEYLRKKEDE